MASRTSVSPSPAGGFHSIASSLSRVAPFVDPTNFDVSKRLSDLEMEQSRLSSKLAVAEKEVALKDQEIKRLINEHRSVKSSLEKVVRELVEKNKQSEAEYKRRLRQSEDALHRMNSEQQQSQQASSSIKSAVQDMKQMLRAKDMELDAMAQENEALRQQEEKLHIQLDNALQQLQRVEEELASTRAQEQESQQDLDIALTKLAKADAHIHKLSLEAESQAMEIVRFKHLCEAADTDAQVTRDEHAESDQKVLRLVRTAAGEMDRLSVECDHVVELTRSLTLAKRSDSMHRTETPGSVPPQPRLFLVMSPERAGAADGDDGGRAAGTMSTQSAHGLIKRLVEAIALAREDVTTFHRALVEVGRHVKDCERRVEVLSEALQQERAIALESVDRVQAAEDALAAERANVVKLESAIAENSRWMEEAAAMSDASAKRTEKLVREKSELQEEIKALQEDAKRQSKRAEEAIAAQHKLEETVRRLEQELHEIRESLRASEKRSELLDVDVADLTQRLHARDIQLRHLEHSNAKNEAEKTSLKKQVVDADIRCASVQSTIESLESINTDLRAKLSETQRRLDHVLRQHVTSTHATPPRQHGHVATAPSGAGGSLMAVSSSSLSSPPPGSSTAARNSIRPNAPVNASVTSSSSGLAIPYRDTRPPFSAPREPRVEQPTDEIGDRVRRWEDRLNGLLSARSRV